LGSCTDSENDDCSQTFPEAPTNNVFILEEKLEERWEDTWAQKWQVFWIAPTWYAFFALKISQQRPKAALTSIMADGKLTILNRYKSCGGVQKRCESLSSLPRKTRLCRHRHRHRSNIWASLAVTSTLRAPPTEVIPGAFASSGKRRKRRNKKKRRRRTVTSVTRDDAVRHYLLFGTGTGSIDTMHGGNGPRRRCSTDRRHTP